MCSKMAYCVWKILIFDTRSQFIYYSAFFRDLLQTSFPSNCVLLCNCVFWKKKKLYQRCLTGFWIHLWYFVISFLSFKVSCILFWASRCSQVHILLDWRYVLILYVLSFILYSLVNMCWNWENEVYFSCI